MARMKKSHPRTENVVVTVYMPPAMVAQVDAAAKREHRQRSSQVVALVDEAFAARKERDLVGSK